MQYGTKMQNVEKGQNILQTLITKTFEKLKWFKFPYDPRRNTKNA